MCLAKYFNFFHALQQYLFYIIYCSLTLSIETALHNKFKIVWEGSRQTQLYRFIMRGLAKDTSKIPITLRWRVIGVHATAFVKR